MALVHHRRPRPVPEAERRAALYARVSKIDDPKTASLDSQIAGGTKLSLDLGIAPDRIDTFIEKFTGEELTYRPVLNEVREAIRQGRYQLLVCYCLDRLARDPVDQAIIIKTARQWGCEVLFVTETFENSESGDLLRYVKGYAAKLEIASIKDRTQRGIVAVLRHGGLTHQGYPIFGYRYTETHLPAPLRTRRAREIDPESAAIVRRIYQAIAIEHITAHTLALQLEAEGVPSPRSYLGLFARDGRPFRWHSSTLREIVRNPVYKGTQTAIYGKTLTVGINERGQSLQRPRPEADWQTFPLTEPTPAIVEEPLWDLANARLDGRKSAPTTRNAKHPRLLRGLIHCATCGHPMYSFTVSRSSTHKRQTFSYYECGAFRTKVGRGVRCKGKLVPALWVEDLVSAHLAAWCQTPDLLRVQLEQALRAPADPQLTADLEALQTEAAKQERLLKAAGLAWSKAAQAGDDDQATIFAEHMAASSTKLKLYREKTSTLQARLQSRTETHAALAHFEAILARGAAALAAGDLSFEEKRSLLEGLQARVTANGRQAEMQFVKPEGSLKETLPNNKFLVVELEEDARSRHP